MKLTHIYTGADNCSHFRDLEIRTTQTELGATTEPVEAESLSLRDTQGGPTETDFRTAPRRQLVMLLRGRVEYGCSDGVTREFGVGDIILFDDTHGEGHRARVLESPRLQAFVRLPHDFDVSSWARPPADPGDLVAEEST